MSRDPVGRTLLVAGGVALFCSLMVSAAVSFLRPVQLAWAQLDRNRLVLELAGLAAREQTLSDREVASRFQQLEVVLIDLATGQPARGWEALSYDPRAVGVLAVEGIDIPPDRDLARLGRQAPLAPVFLSYAEGRLQRVVLPLWGQGMWAPVEAYLAFAGDCETATGFAVLEHGETPGIGDRIEQHAWRASWVGLKSADMLRETSAIDTITGATVTVGAISRMTRYWLGPEGFGPFLERCRAGETVPP